MSALFHAEQTKLSSNIWSPCEIITYASAPSDLAAAKAAGQNPGDEQVILLAPAAASFDQFSSFEARGEAFCRLASQQIAKFQATVPASYREAGHV